jgi:hypothetical protein
LDELASAAQDVADTYHRLVLLVAPIAGGKTLRLTSVAREEGWPILNVNHVVASGLLELDTGAQAIQCKQVLAGVLSSTAGSVVALDNIEMLFEEQLRQDPLRLFQSLSRTTTLVVSWPGSFDGRNLTFADPGHRDYRKYADPGVRILTMQHA